LRTGVIFALILEALKALLRFHTAWVDSCLSRQTAIDPKLSFDHPLTGVYVDVERCTKRLGLLEGISRLEERRYRKYEIV
jgi:hypothetical protein